MRKKISTENSLFRIGLNIRAAREKRKLTLDELAQRTNLSKGLLSKIENFRTLPSLPVLAAVARSLGINLENLVKNVGQQRPTACQVVRAADREQVKREKSRGFNYSALVARSFGNTAFEAVVLKLAPGAKRKSVSTDGDEFIFMLKGEINFKLGNDSLRLDEGDALFFDGRVPHTPSNPGKSSAELLVIYLLNIN
jgi:transcriptional regulator with XRE-family HTH domain